MENATVDCKNCGDKNIVEWKKACEEGCPECGSANVEIYGEE